MQGKDIILGILSQHSCTGYDIKEILKNDLSGCYNGTFGMIYPTLNKLEKEGKVKKEKIVQKKKPDKNIYSITDKGIKEFDNYVNSSLERDKLKSDFLVRMYLGSSLSKKRLRKIITDQITYKSSLLDLLIKRNINNKENVAQSLAVSYEIAICEAEIRTLELYLRQLD